MTQARLDLRGEVEHEVDEAQSLKDFKVAACINNHVGAPTFQLLKRDGLPGPAREARACRRVRK